jgi:vacuolar protein sorting-associated protein 13A/C
MDQLSSLLVYYLSRALGTLFEGDFTENNISLEISSGFFSLENVQLKEQFFSDLPVSMVLSHGSIGKLDISIPWKNMGSAPLTVSLDGVNILLTPCFVKDTKSSAARKAHQLKLAKLSSVDSLCKIRGTASSHGSSMGGLLFHYLKEKLVSAIINTLEITVTNVHIR